MRILASLFAALALGSLSAPELMAGTAATVAIDASTILRSVSPSAQIGQNFDLWTNLTKVQSYQARLVAAGVRHFRYPGGALADIFHWNSNGSYNAAGRWEPNNAAFTAPGFRSDLRYRGTTDRGSSVGSFASKITDGSTATEWRSNTLSAHGINPWFYIDLGSAMSVNKITTTWGAPYATGYKVQSYTGASTSPYQDSAFNWTDRLTVAAGTGGVDTQTFAGVTARFFRVELTASSGSGFAVQECQLLNNFTQRTTNVNNPATQSLAVAAPTDIASDANATGVFFGFEDFMTFINGYPGGAQPIITVNLGTGTPEEAAAWVHYANVVRGYGIKRWELGNEVEGVQMPGGPFNGYFYAERLKAFSAAMRAEDPTILISGPDLAWLESPSHLYDGTSFTTAMFNRLQATASLNTLDVIAFHDYPFWANNVPATSLASWQNWPASKNAYLQAINSTYYPGSPRPVHLSEANSGDATNFTVMLTNGLWAASYFAEFLKTWGSDSLSSYWFNSGDMYQGGDGTWGDHGMFEGQNNVAIPVASRGQPRADYWATYLLKSVWMKEGLANDLISCTSSQTLLPAYALHRGDDHLTLLLVNLSSATTYSAAITLSAFAPNANATITTYAGAASGSFYTANYVWLQSGYNSYATTDLSPTVSVYPGVSASFSHDVPPYSITIFDFTNSNATFTPTPVVSPTPTSTPVTSFVWDDYEQNQTLAGWQGYAWGTASLGSMALNAGCAEAGSLGFSAVLTTGTNGGGGYILGSPYGGEALDGGWLPNRQYRDLTGSLALEAWIKCSSTALELKLQAEEAALNGGDSEQWTAAGNAGQYVTTANVWQKVSFPISGFIRTAGAGDNTFDIQAVKQLELKFWGMNQTGVSVCIDEIRFVLVAPATPTPTFSRSPTPSASSTATGSATPTPTVSPSITLTATGTASATPTASPSRTASLTASETSTASPSATRTVTLSATITASVTATPTDVPPGSTLTPTPSISLTATPTPSASGTTSPSGTATPSASPSPTSSITLTGTPTSTETPTASPTPTPSASPSNTAPPTLTISPTNTPLPTLTTTPASTATNTPLATLTTTPASTATNTPLATLTTTPASTATNTPLATLTSTPASTATNTPLATLTTTASNSATHTPTATRTVTATGSPSFTSSVTLTTAPNASSTAAGSPSFTVTPSATSTAQATLTQTVTSSPQLSSTSTASLSATLSVAPSLTNTPTGPLPSATASPGLSASSAATPAPIGPPVILDAAFAPNPATGMVSGLALRLDQTAEQVSIDIYTRDFKLVSRQLQPGMAGPGWAKVTVDLDGFGGGLYFARIGASNRFGRSGYGQVVKLWVLR